MSWELFRQKLAIMRKINIMGVVFKLPRVSIWDAVKGICRCNTSMFFSFGVLSPSGELQIKKVEPINCIKNATYRPHLVLHWCHFINGFHIWLIVLISDDTILNRIHFDSPLLLRGLILPNVRCPVSSYIMPQNLICVKQVSEIWGAEVFPHLIVLNRKLVVLRSFHNLY